MGKPLVSCLCVSRPARWGQLQRAVTDFILQTYDQRELLIVVDKKTAYFDLASSFIRQRFPDHLAKIKVFARNGVTQLEGLQYALMQARGEVITLWDDDNLNHPSRLAAQVQQQLCHPDALTANAGVLYYFHDSNELYAVDLEAPAVQPADRCAVSTLMGLRDNFPALEPRHRAKPAEMMLNAHVREGGKLVTLNGLYHHLVGVTHDNLRGYEKHRRFAQERGWRADRLVACHEEIDHLLKTMSWDVDCVDVCGTDARAYRYDASKQKWPATYYSILTQDGQTERVTETTV